jgi:hypothetical protein
LRYRGACCENSEKAQAKPEDIASPEVNSACLRGQFWQKQFFKRNQQLTAVIFQVGILNKGFFLRNGRMF